MQPGSDFKALEEAHQLYKSGQLAEAIDRLKKLIEEKPETYQAWIMLSQYLMNAGYHEEAFLVSTNAEQYDPLAEDFTKIQQAMQNSAFAEVERIAIEMLKKHPGHPRAIFSLAHVVSLSPTAEQAIDILKAGLDYHPANFSLRQKLIETLDALGRYEEAIAESRHATKINKAFDTHWTYVNLLHKHAQYDDIQSVCQQTKELADDNNLIHSQLNLIRGEANRIVGDRQSSVTFMRKAIEQNNFNVEAWWALADLKNYQFSDQDRELIQSVLAAEPLDDKLKSIATFALAKASEQMDDWDHVMALYDKANKQYPTPYAPSLIENDFATIKAACSQTNLAIQSEPSKFDKTPIFIVGLPRSGSTLVEQMLASHSQIEGTIEQPTLPSIEKQAQSICFKKRQKGLYEALDCLAADELSQLGQAYIDNGKLYREFETQYFTDKNPFNFRSIGFIHKILPEAIIIDVRRNPLDCGFSLYRQYFSSGVDFSYNLEHIGAFYNAYLSLMSHWNRVLPGKVFTLQYEALIRDPEQQLQRLFEHIGLPFEAGCLEFHKTDRAIRTASSEQVRQPLNDKGMGAWQVVDEHLAPLRNALGETTMAQFSEYY